MSFEAIIPISLIQSFLERLNINADPSLLRSSAATLSSNVDVEPNPAVWITQLLELSNIKGVRAYPIPLRRLDMRRLPALVLHDENWYICDLLVTGKMQFTDDLGRTLEVEENAIAQSKAIWLSVLSDNSFKEIPDKTNLATKWILKSLFKEPGWFVNVVMATLVINCLAVTTSLFAMQVYDRVVPTMAFATLTTLVVGMGIVITMDWGLKILRARILDSVSISVDKEVSQRVFEHLLRLRLDTQPKSLGTLAAQFSGIDAIRNFFSSGIIFGLIDLPFAIIFIAFIGVIGGAVAWVYVILLPSAVLVGLISQFRLSELLKKQVSRQNERQGILVDTIRGAESIRASNSGWRFANQWRDITDSIDAYNIQQKAISSFTTITTSTLSSIAYVAAVVVGVFQIEAGLMTTGGIIACSIIGGRVIAPVSMGVQYFIQWQHVRQSLKMVNNVLSLDTERLTNKNLLMPTEVPSSLEVEKLSYAYPGSPVKQVDIKQLKFNSGDRVVLLGPVGCGKSTLLKMLAGLYPPNSGRIRLGPADLWEIDPQIIASNVGYLPQHVHLFKGTLRMNLTISGAESDSHMLQVARELGVDKIAANSPLGMDLQISEGGDGLSGGQRQLVALARLVINAPKIWLLDEPTASLDAESELLVWSTLKNYVQNDDILIVATHRPMKALAWANRVVVIRNGDVVADDVPSNVFPKMFPDSAKKASKIPGNTVQIMKPLQTGELDVV